MRLLPLLALGTVTSLGACLVPVDEASRWRIPDGGRADGAGLDSSWGDGGPGGDAGPDAGLVDGGEPDAGLFDAGTPDAGPVDAGGPPPMVVVVVDRSGSMVGTLTGMRGGCSIRGDPNLGYDPQSTQPCKWKDVRDTLADPSTGALRDLAGSALVGLVALPGDPQDYDCSAGRTVVQVGSDVAQVMSAVRALEPLGGTPTTSALAVAYEELVRAGALTDPSRRRGILLITDGAPNCGWDEVLQSICYECDMNSNACSGPGACNPTDGMSTCSDPQICVDGRNLIGVAGALRNASVALEIVGYGPDLAEGSEARGVLLAAAAAAADPRTARIPYTDATSRDLLDWALREALGYLAP